MLINVHHPSAHDWIYGSVNAPLQSIYVPLGGLTPEVLFMFNRNPPCYTTQYWYCEIIDFKSKFNFKSVQFNNRIANHICCKYETTYSRSQRKCIFENIKETNTMCDKCKIKANASPLYYIWLYEKKTSWGFVWGKIRSPQYKTHRLRYKATPRAYIWMRASI